MGLCTRVSPEAVAIATWLCTCSIAWSGPIFGLLPGAPLPTPDTKDAVAVWEQGAGRSGGAALRIAPAMADSRAVVRVLAGPKLLVAPGLYRVEAWVKTDKSDCGVDLVLYDMDSGRELARCPAFTRVDAAPFGVTDGPGRWRFRACDVYLKNDRDIVGYNIESSACGGSVLIDHLKVADSASMLPNGDFTQLETDAPAPPTPATKTAASLAVPRGWRRRYDPADADRQAEGSFGVERDPLGNTLAVTKGKGTFVLWTEPMAIPETAGDLVASVRVDGHADPLPVAAMCQYGRRGLVREDRSSRVYRVPGETVATTGRVEIRPGTERILLLLHFPDAPGTYHVRRVEVSLPAPPGREIEILADQVGYDTGEPLRFLVATRSFPPEGPAAFSLTNDRGESCEGRLTPLGRCVGQDESDWGRYYFEGVLADATPGLYTLTARLGQGIASVERLAVAPRLRVRETGELAYRFYSIQRCGCSVPGYHGPCHMDDGRLPDGTHIDVTGGYHSAGDFHKHMGDNAPVSVYAMLQAYEAHKGFFDAIDRDGNGRADLLDEAAWGADWLRKMADPKTLRFRANVTNDIDYYGLPDQETDGIPGTGDDRVIGVSDSPDLGPFAIAAWAALSRHVPESGGLELGERLWAASEDRILAGHDPRHIFAALELARSTNRPKYRSACRRLVPGILALQDRQGWFAARPGGGPEFRIVDEGTPPAALAYYALAEPHSPLIGRVRESLMNYVAWSLRMADNPFGLIRNYTGGEPFFFKGRDTWFGGGNSQYGSTAWAAYLASHVFRDDRALRLRLRMHAANQMHWILGANPLNLCMFEGKGNSNRIHYHHMFVEVPGHPRGDVAGAIPNGFTRDPGNADRPWFDLRTQTGSLAGAESAEPWLPHNAYYLLMLSAMPTPGPIP